MKRFAAWAAAILMGLTVANTAQAARIDLSALGLQLDGQIYSSSAFVLDPPLSVITLDGAEVLAGPLAPVGNPADYGIFGDLTSPAAAALGSEMDVAEFLFVGVVSSSMPLVIPSSNPIILVVYEQLGLGPDPLNLTGNGGIVMRSIGTLSIYNVAPIPLPATLPLALGGIAVFGWAVRRRRKN